MPRIRSAVVHTIVAFLTIACATGRPVVRDNAPFVTALPNSELLQLGVKALQGGDVEKARGYFRHVLKYDPRNANAHAALAATFDIDASGGDRTQRDVAKVGYELALNFDPKQWFAAYRLGALEIDDGQYSAAINHLSNAAVLRRDDPVVLMDLARALYLDGQLPMARAVVERAIATGADDAATFHHAALIAAAGGDSVQAGAWQQQFARLSTNPDAQLALARRMDDWKVNRAWLAGKASATARTGGAAAAPRADSLSIAQAQRSPFLTPGTVEQRTTLLAPLPPMAAGTKARMVQVDLMIIRTEEIETNKRGTNLLRGLQLQFGGENSRTINKSGPEGGPLDASVSQTLSRSLTVPAVSYSLEIANSGFDRNDVLARPTLIALDGQPANFFIGEELSIPVTSQLSSNLSDKTIGIEVAVTPTFLDDNTVLLAVSASRSFLNTFFVPSVNSALRTTQQRVTTAIVADFGKTVVLSGLTEHESKTSHDGVPLLQELPGIQYLFSTKNTLLFQKSVMIAITARAVGQTIPARSESEGTVEVSGLTQMREFFPYLESRARTLAVVGHDLQQNTFRELLAVDDMSSHASQFSRREWIGQVAKQLWSLLVF